MDTKLNSILDLYLIDKDIMCNNVIVDGTTPEISKWQKFLTDYVTVITSSTAENIPQKYYSQFIDWIELISTCRFHRLWSQKKRFDEAMNVYHKLYSNPPDKIVLCSCHLLLFYDIMEQFLSDLQSTGLSVGMIVNPYYKYTTDETQEFTDQILFLIIRNNKYFAKVDRLLFHPCLDVHAILSANSIRSRSPVTIAIGPTLIKKLLSPTVCSIFSKNFPINTTVDSIHHMQELLKHTLARLIELQIDDHETFFYLRKTIHTAKQILPIEYLMIKLGFVPEICRAAYTYKQSIELNGKTLINAPDTVYFSLTDMLIQHAHVHPAIFCWVARMIDLALDAPPTIVAVKDGLDIAKVKTISIPYYVFTHQAITDLDLNFVCFLAKKRNDMTTQSILQEFLSRDSSKLLSGQKNYFFHLTNSLPYATLTKHASAFIKAYLYLRLIDGYTLEDISFTDIDDIYTTITNPTEFYSRLDKEQYTPSKFIALVKERHSQLNFCQINNLFISIEIQLIRGLNFPQGLSEKHFKQDALQVKNDNRISQECINLEDPISRARIKTPVRGCNCKHVACFDLETFISYACETDRWNCPMCAEIIGLSMLYIDAYQYTIINYLVNLGYSDRKILIDSVTNMPIFSRREEKDDSILSDWVEK